MLKRKLGSIGLIICFLVSTFSYSAFGGTLPVPMTNFQPPLLKYLSINTHNPYNYFNFLVDTGENTLNGRTQGPPLQNNVKQLINYFFLGLTLPEDSFWVNLNPNEPNRLTSDSLSKTDMGKALLEQDLLLKKQTSQYLNPRNKIGKQFWKRLYKGLSQRGLSLKKQAITTSNRVWIVPDKATVVETEDGVLITEAKLKVLTETDYLSSNPNWNPRSNAGLEQVNQLSQALMKEIIIPELTKDVNNSKKYAKLRQIYHSLILASYYKEKNNQSSPYDSILNKNNTTGLESQYPWSKDKLFQQYLNSYKKGEYKIKQKFQGTNRMYSSGGIGIGSSAINAIMEVTSKGFLANTAVNNAVRASAPMNHIILSTNPSVKKLYEIEISAGGVASSTMKLYVISEAKDIIEEHKAEILKQLSKIKKHGVLSATKHAIPRNWLNDYLKEIYELDIRNLTKKEKLTIFYKVFGNEIVVIGNLFDSPGFPTLNFLGPRNLRTFKDYTNLIEIKKEADTLSSSALTAEDVRPLYQLYSDVSGPFHQNMGVQLFKVWVDGVQSEKTTHFKLLIEVEGPSNAKVTNWVIIEKESRDGLQGKKVWTKSELGDQNSRRNGEIIEEFLVRYFTSKERQEKTTEIREESLSIYDMLYGSQKITSTEEITRLEDRKKMLEKALNEHYLSLLEELKEAIKLKEQSKILFGHVSKQGNEVLTDLRRENEPMNNLSEDTLQSNIAKDFQFHRIFDWDGNLGILQKVNERIKKVRAEIEATSSALIELDEALEEFERLEAEDRRYGASSDRLRRRGPLVNKIAELRQAEEIIKKYKRKKSSSGIRTKKKISEDINLPPKKWTLRRTNGSIAIQ